MFFFVAWSGVEFGALQCLRLICFSYLVWCCWHVVLVMLQVVLYDVALSVLFMNDIMLWCLCCSWVLFGVSGLLFCFMLCFFKCMLPLLCVC